MTNYTLVLAAGKQGLKKHFITREELRAIAMPGLDQSELDSDDKKMIQKILDFRDVTAEECMTPLINLIAIDESSSADYAIQRSRESSYSRLLVFKERIYDITGIIHTFDLLKLPEDENSLKNIIQPAFYVPESKRVDDLFQQMQDKGDHMAVVVDEYGAAVGIITIEDMLEEIVGEIEDEFDKIPSLYEKKGKGFYEIKGEMEIDMINEELEIQLPSGDYETLSGLVTNKMGKIPKAEEILSLEEYQIIVKEADPRKVKLLEVKKKVNP
jgi:CBS domain containing-hemolysin-like protein